MTMNPIRLPRAAAKMKQFAEVVTRSHDRAVEIRQDASGAILTAADGHQLCRITAPPPAGVVAGPVEPFLVDARALAKAAADVGCSRSEPFASVSPDQVAPEDRPILVVKIDDKTVGVAGPTGSPQTIRVEPGAMPDCVKIVEAIRREAGTGATKAVARFDPRFLQNLADTAVALGITSIEITFAPRFNFIMAEGSGPDGCTAEFAIAGIGDIDFEEFAQRSRPAWEQDDALTFTMPEAMPRAKTTRRPKQQTNELPFDDIPF